MRKVLNVAREAGYFAKTLATLALKGKVNELPRFPQWLKSLIPGKYPISDKIPWITYDSMEWLESYIQPDMKVFEFGPGGSTMYFSPRIKQIVAVEHDKGWYEYLVTSFKEQGVKNCELMLKEPKKLTQSKSYHYDSYTSNTPGYEDKSFENYVKSIDKYPDQSFDLVIVDGRSRASCLIRAIPKVKDGGYLLLDNSQRTQYHCAHEILNNYECTDFPGLSPYVTTMSQTSVWKITHKKKAKKSKSTKKSTTSRRKK